MCWGHDVNDYSSHAVLDVAGRAKKARKIERVLKEYGRVPIHGQMLEVGAGSGVISAYFAEKYAGALSVSAVDVQDQRITSGGFDFRLYDGERLPFNDGKFDLIVSNHVIEHVGSRDNQQRHLSELARVLAKGGTLYLATPSKWQIVEPHFRLPWLSWIPYSMRDKYVRLAGRGERYDCNPLGHRELERMAAHGRLSSRNSNAYAFRVLCEERGGWLARCLRHIPLACLNTAYRISPTMVYLLQHGT